MNICVLTHTFPRNKSDVSAAFMKEFCDGLIDSGNKVVVITPFDKIFHREGDPFKVVTYKYIWPEKLHSLGYSKTMEGDIKLKKRAYLLLPFMLVLGFLALLQTVKREKIDIISVHWILPNGLIALLVSKITRTPFTVTIPGTDAFLSERYKPFGLVAKMITRGASALFSNSSWNLRKILNLGVKPRIVEVITYPVDISKFKPITHGIDNLRRKYGLTKENLVILAVGRLVYKKGFNYLIEAMPQVVKRYPFVRLIIGGEGDLFGQWRDLSVRLGIGDKVQFAGTIKRDEILFYYNLADIVATPSIIDQEGNVDGRPLVILESMACGKPQIVTNLPGISDALVDGVNALLVPQKNSQEISQALLRLIKSRDLRRKMGERNMILARSLFSTKSVGEQYTKFFNQIVQHSRINIIKF